MPQYGRTTAGASWQSVEARYLARTITLASGETATKMSAYLRSVGTATNGLRMALYNHSDDTLAYQSAVLAGFTDTTGGWKDFTFTDAVAAGTYRLMVTADAIAGGGNTVECAHDTVASDTTNYQNYFYGVVGESWPTMGADLTGAEVPGGTHNASMYLETSAGGGGFTPRMMLLGVG
jgi:hypothetical protein